MKKGFTLVEVLGVIVVLSIILIMTVPAVTSSLNRTENKKYEQFVTEVNEATEIYIQYNRDAFSQLDQVGGSVIILVGDVIDSGYIRSDTINPKTKAVINSKEKIKITVNQDKTLKIEYPYAG